MNWDFLDKLIEKIWEVIEKCSDSNKREVATNSTCRRCRRKRAAVVRRARRRAGLDWDDCTEDEEEEINDFIDKGMEPQEYAAQLRANLASKTA